jgi:ubiquinone/menaquinone biosynthesis C-methylase UbiE
MIDAMAARTQATAPELYERWAPTYAAAPDNPLMQGEQAAMLAAWPHVAGKRALDLACGRGRYTKLLIEHGATHVVGLDLSMGMLQRAAGVACVRADMQRLPLRDGVFDISISGLAVGHVAQLDRWTSEVARVLSAQGVLLYSDFHPEAARAGLTRSFKDSNARTWAVPHHCHAVSAQREALAAAGLTVDTVTELRVGENFNEVFSGSERFYRECAGLPLLLIIRAHK